MKKSTQQHSSAIQTTCRLFKMAPLALAVSLASMAVAPMAQATDLDIYNGAESSGGETTVMLVLDVSQQMGNMDDVEAKLVCPPYKPTGCTKEEKVAATGVTAANTAPSSNSALGADDAVYDFDRTYIIGTDGKYYYNQLDRIKMALYHIFDIQKIESLIERNEDGSIKKDATGKEITHVLDEKLSAGLSISPMLDNEGGSSGRQQSMKGYILVPAHPLNYRYPGAKTQATMPMNDTIRNDRKKANLPKPSSDYAGWTQKDRLHDAIRRLQVGDYSTGATNALAIGYMETASYLLGTQTRTNINSGKYASGMNYSADDSKSISGARYVPPSATGGTCSQARGVFLLTPGPSKTSPAEDTTPGVLSRQVIDYKNSLPEMKQYVPQVSCLFHELPGSSARQFSMLHTYNSYHGKYESSPPGDDKQWMCGLAFARFMRGYNSIDTPDYRKNIQKVGTAEDGRTIYRSDGMPLFSKDYKKPVIYNGETYPAIPGIKDKQLNILTGMMAFGGVMDLYNDPRMKVYRFGADGNEHKVTECSRDKLNKVFPDLFTNLSDAITYENFCKFSEETYGFGEGGLYSGKSAVQIANALNSFVAKLDTGEVNLPPMSTGTMSVPFDSLNQLTPRISAYVPVLDPKIGTQDLWPGNLKKYTIKDGTIVGKLDGKTEKVFTSRVGFFNPNTKDLWNTNTTKDEAKPQVGGTYQQILKGVTTSPVNTVNRKTLIDYKGQLNEIKVQAGEPSGFNVLNWSTVDQIALNSEEKSTINALTDSEKANAIKKRAQVMKQQLVNFLGYPVTAGNIIKDKESLVDASGKAIQQTQDNRILGGVVHSRPQIVTYDAVLNDDGSVASRKDYLLYGSFDGALHMVDDTNGTELFSFVPHQVLQRQGKAFSPISSKNLGDPTKPPYLHGVDAEWAVYGDYKRTAPDKKAGITKYGIKAESMFAFGGLRMGGSMYYGLNITDRNEPKMLYSIGSNYALGVGKGKFATTGYKNDSVDTAYSRMGLTWGKPTVAYVKQGGKKVMVNILPGGYDECYEDPHFQLGSSITTNTINGCNGKTSAQGNAVYIVKVAEEEKDSNGVTSIKTTGVSGIGEALWWASSNATGSKGKEVEGMKHSVVNQVLALDGNYDGLTDHLYYADLGGQVWRADINNDKDTDDFKVERVVKVFDASKDAETIIEGSGDTAVSYKYIPRIYDTPLVTFQRLGNEGKIHGVVTVGTGDRSNPLNKDFSNNHIYTFIDKDLARYRSELFCTDDKATTTNECEGFSFTPLTKDLNPDHLIAISYNKDGTPTNAAETQTAIDNGIEGKTDGKVGWKYKLVDSGFIEKLNKDKKPGEADKNPKGLKMYNRPDAINGQLYVSIFSPEITNKEDGSAECSVAISGETNRERLCLPYGYCYKENADGTSTAINRSTLLAGGGIVDNYITYLGNTDADGKPTKTIGILDTYCEGDDCKRNEGSEINPLDDNGLNETAVEHGFIPLKWFER